MWNFSRNLKSRIQVLIFFNKIFLKKFYYLFIEITTKSTFSGQIMIDGGINDTSVSASQYPANSITSSRAVSDYFSQEKKDVGITRAGTNESKTPDVIQMSEPSVSTVTVTTASTYGLLCMYEKYRAENQIFLVGINDDSISEEEYDIG